MTFDELLEKYRFDAFSQRDKGDKFERLMQAYLRTDPQYAPLFKNVWLWKEFFGRIDLGGRDTGIDLVAETIDGEFWAVQCKFYLDTQHLDLDDVSTFLSTSSRTFKTEDFRTIRFARRLWIATTNRFTSNAENAFENQDPPVTLIKTSDLREAPVDWAKLEEGIHGEPARTEKKRLRPHQTTARDLTNEYFKTRERGKLIMACGTGKTFNSLRIAENETGGKGLVLFLVPSIALLGQTLREWSADADEQINAVCICSDPEVTKQRGKKEDADHDSVIDLAFPASTNAASVVKQFKYFREYGNQGMTVVFSTYQSIDVVARAQADLIKNGFPEFDLIICDEAHRTTGVTLTNEDESAFTKVHDNEFIRGKKRLYMTATPRLYSDDAKSKAAQAEAVLCSMDDPAMFGDEIYRIGFGEAVERDLLTDYKVLILTLSDKDVPPAVQEMIADEKSEINSDDASKLIGCINALSKQILGDHGDTLRTDPQPMKRAVAFCPKIVASKKITEIFNTATDAYISSLPATKREQMVSVASKHVDGTMGAPKRDELLSWLKQEPKLGECRILTNVRCLSEGVDVPSLDAVMFLSARNSPVDVVQSVGRVMRKAPGKKYGYIIIPVVVPSEVEAEKALDDNERYKVVWTVLNALRAHDDRFNATVNKIELNKKKPTQILIGKPEVEFRDGQAVLADPTQEKQNRELAKQLSLQFEQLQNIVFARMVNKVGDRRYWEHWAKNVAEIAERQVERIKRLIADGGRHEKAFEKFLGGLQKNINPSITQQEAIEMLSQHIITKPVFEALFEGYSFVKNNPVSISMQTMLDLLEGQAIEKDTETLAKFYESVKMRASGIDNAEGKQKIIIELYDKFFKTAFPKMVERLGIVYTPVEVVDFIIHSVNDVLKQEFGRSLSDENVNILDPFTGTGTFITRLLQSGLIEPKDLERKYRHEIFANEIVLLAYYIAAVNIENAFHDATPDPDDGIGKDKYIPFEGICLTDTFQLGESDDGEKLFSDMFPQNSKRVQRQQRAPLRVIFGNPPYSVGQRSANDNAQNQRYEKLDARIADTYAANTKASNKNSLYDSYFKAFRWSTDRLDAKNGGVIAFVSNGSWIDGNAQDGFRKILEKDFSSCWVFNLRGNQRTSGELSRKEGGKIFGSGSRTPISITVLIKNPEAKSQKATIHYRDIGDYLSREEKLSTVATYKSVANPEMQWQELLPNDHGDWINVRNDSFSSLFPLGDKNEKGSVKSFFVPFYGRGLATTRDSWCYNSSAKSLISNVRSSIDFFNHERGRFNSVKVSNGKVKPNEIISFDETKFSWSDGPLAWLSSNREMVFDEDRIFNSSYRPYFKQKCYFDRCLNERVYQQPKAFPNSKAKNIVICVPGVGVTKEFSCIASDVLPDLELIGKSQCFPLYYYEEKKEDSPTLFDGNGQTEYIRRDGVSDFILEQARSQYGNNVGKEDIFYYVYGFLHSPEYRETFANDLKKMLPRLPLVEDVKDFWAFSRAGRTLADLHINYEDIPPHPDVTVSGATPSPYSEAASPPYLRKSSTFPNDASLDQSGSAAGGTAAESNEGDTVKQSFTANRQAEPANLYRVEKMRFPAKGQKDTIIYNSSITISNIPAKAYEYVVNGKSAIEWIMERYQITTHKDSGIRNDPNDWSTEVGNPRYILDLLLSIINVSTKSVDIVNELPNVKFK